MTAASQTTGFRPPPPSYYEALTYPVNCYNNESDTAVLRNGELVHGTKYSTQTSDLLFYQKFENTTVQVATGGQVETLLLSDFKHSDVLDRKRISRELDSVLESIPEAVYAETYEMGVKSLSDMQSPTGDPQRESLILACSGGHRGPGSAMFVNKLLTSPLDKNGAGPSETILLDSAQQAVPERTSSNGDVSISVSHSPSPESALPPSPSLESSLQHSPSQVSNADSDRTIGNVASDSGIQDDSRTYTDTVLYPDSEYSSSDASIKATCDTSRYGYAKCQKTLKGTYNGVNHTVYELSPSDSFYSSVGEGIQSLYSPPSLSSSEGTTRLGRSSSSLVETRRERLASKGQDDSDSRTSLIPCRKTSLPEESTLSGGGESNTSTSVQTCKSQRPLKTSPSAEQTTAAVPAAAYVLDKEYDRKGRAADRGTLYCACGGVVVVATIVILLIHFS